MAQTPKPRDYKKEYREFQGTPEQISNRSSRNSARRVMTKEVGATALRGKDVDHKTPLKSGGSTGRKNLRIMSVKENRGRNN